MDSERVDVSVVVAIFNEEESIPPLCERLDGVMSKLGKSYEIVLIDDGSSDRSWERLNEAAERYAGLKLVRFRRNFGQTPAMSAGFDESRGDIVITMDADLQNDPEDIPMLLDRMAEGVDVVSGWRKDRKDRFINRRLPSIIANALISKITGVHLHDYGCSLKAYRCEIVKNVRLYGEMHRFIPALASWVGGRLDEVVVRHHARQFGTSKYGISRTFRVILDLMTVKFLLRYSTHPIQMFGKIGLMFGVPGFLLLVFAAGANLSANLFHTTFAATMIKRPFWVIMPFMLMLFCMQFIVMGLLAEVQIRTYHESQNKPIYVVRNRVSSKLPGGAKKGK